MTAALHYHGRAERYLADEITDVPCLRCGEPSKQQFNVCANGGHFVPLCPACDVALNELVLTWLGVENTDALMAAYRAEILP
jgi:hypothetical protein